MAPIQSTFDSFNPKEGNVAPGSYIGLFKPIESYETPSPFGIALKGAASLLDKSLEAANALVLNEGRNQVETKLEPMRDEYTQALEGAKQYVAAASKPTATNTYQTDLIPGPEGGSPEGTPIQAADVPEPPTDLLARAEGTPDEIKGFEKKLDVLGSARGDGKFSETEFWGRVRDATKDIRNRFPIGYRPEIDAMVAAKFGTTPANAYIQGMIRDINSSLSDAQQRKNATFGWLRSHADKDGIPRIIQDFSSGNIDEVEAIRRASVPLRQESIINESLRRLELQGKGMEMDRKNAESEAKGIANAVLTSKLSTITSGIGIDGKLQETYLKAQRGDITLTAQESIALARRAEALRVETQEAIRNKLTTLRGGRSYATLTDQDYVNKLAEDASQHFAVMRDGFHKGDVSVGAWRAQAIEAAKTDYRTDVAYGYPEMNQLLLNTDLLKNYGMPDANIQEMIRPSMLPNSPARQKFDQMTAMLKFNIATPKELEGSINLKIQTFKEGLEHFKTIQKTTGEPLPDRIEEFTKIIDGDHGASLINTKDPRIADAIAQRTFGPGNENAFKYFKSNMYDDKGRMIPGAQALFNRFAQPDVVKKIMSLSPERQKEYTDFMTTASREDLLRNDLPYLKEVINSPNAPWQLAWNSTSKNFEITPSPAFNQTNIKPEMRARLGQYVSNVNQVLNGLKSIAVTSGKKDDDIDAFVLNPIVQSLGDISGTPGLATSLATTIKNAYAQKRFEQEQARRQQEETRKKYFEGPK